MGETRRRRPAAPRRARRWGSRPPRSRERALSWAELPHRSLSLLQCRGQLRDLSIDIAILGKRPASAAVPVARVAEIAFHDVHDAVRPATEPRFILLHDGVGFCPLSFFEMAYRRSNRHGSP